MLRDEEYYDYRVMRLMRKSRNQSIVNHKKKYPDMTVVFEIYYSPNSVNLWNRIKKKLGNKKIEYSGSNFNLKKNYTERMLIKDIKNIHNERLDTDNI